MPTFQVQDTDPVTGIITTVHGVEGRVAIQKTYDAEPFLELASAERAATDGQRWGDFRKVGSVPMAVLSTWYRQDGGLDMKRAAAWLKANPQMVTFGKFLK